MQAHSTVAELTCEPRIDDETDDQLRKSLSDVVCETRQECPLNSCSLARDGLETITIRKHKKGSSLSCTEHHLHEEVPED
eukprot:3934932-Rhodomonas_salina.2